MYRKLEDAGTLDQVLEQRRRLQGSRYYLGRCKRDLCKSLYFELQRINVSTLPTIVREPTPDDSEPATLTLF